MIADFGAATIKALIEEPSTELAAAVEKLGAGLAAAEGLNGEVPPSTDAAITKLRGIYSALAQRIKSTGTDNSGPKNEALAGLAAMDVGLSQLQTGIQDGYGKAAEKALEQATKKMERAANQLDHAAASIT
jgi:hypothetical protein